MELTQDKTKRKLIAYLSNYRWTHQASFFYIEQEESKNLLSDQQTLRNWLRRTYADRPFFVWVRLLKPKEGRSLQAYLTAYTTSPLGLAPMRSYASLEVQVVNDMNVMEQAVSPHDLISTVRSVRKQKLHDLTAFFGVKSVKRFDILNKKHLEAHQDESYLGSLELDSPF